ncbi:MAG: PLDc N-terminal domain-containing protein [Candidatus Pacearchaeota archaeon]|jgi:preprotein translocase subunit YajC
MNPIIIPLLILGFLSILSLIVFIIIFWILMIIDCLQRKFQGDSEKTAWILVLIFLQFFGAVLYYFIIKRNDKEKKKKR